MMKLALAAAAATLLSSTAHADRPFLPDSYVGAPVEAMVEAYGAPIFEAVAEDGRTVVVFEVVSYENPRSAVAMRSASYVQVGSASAGDLIAARSQRSRYDDPARQFRSRMHAHQSPFSQGHLVANVRALRAVPVTCQVGAALGADDTVEVVSVNHPFCRSLSLR
jgi:hypothetical protein